ncbi:hypothetical protein PybrP1_010163 [[Pythium] brassicae (nom. inval.)]|nr:hypothetical protein PybrP1_010163 [[Pythium] brassicae (nom. inval.)]
MRRQNSAEQRYAEAFASAERGKQLERDAATDDAAALAAVAAFEDAIRVLSRLAVVESAAKRALVLDAVAGLRERVRKIERSAAYALAKAMALHAAAREQESAGEAPARDVIDAYLAAGDWYMKALAALGGADGDAGAAVKEQVEYVIEHVSELKQQQLNRNSNSNSAEESATPAPPPPAVVAQSHALATSDAFLQSRVSFSSLEWPEPPPPDLDAALLDAMEEELGGAEAAEAADAPAPAKPRGAAYSPQELDVLRRSSLINGHLFLPWVDDLDAREPFDGLSPALFEDPDGDVPLSAKQRRKGARWLRPLEFAALCGRAPVVVASLSPQAVKQDVVTDCSFVASLCIAAAYEQRFKKPLISHLLRPVDPGSRQPRVSPSGKYVVKLWANGVPRKVVIDDRLPVSAATGQLLTSCTTRANELWVPLIEKAYLKLNGGYDFPGGNSGIDLFALTGWIPERVATADLRARAATEERLWAQLQSAFHFGDCIITMSTGDLDRDDARRIGLVPMHVYAVLNVYEVANSGGDGSDQRPQRLLQLKNPWRKMSWRGPFSRLDTALWESPVGDELRAYQRQFYPPSDVGTGDGDDNDNDNDGDDDDDGLFWIDLASVKRYFESIYLNWNPALFPHRDVCHAHWPRELGPANDALTLGFNPQYALTLDPAAAPGGGPASATVWVLLSRHVRVVERDADQATQQFLTLHVYQGEADGKRVFFSQNALWRGAYSNNPHTLVSLDVDLSAEPAPSFTLVASQYEKFAPLDFTISVFATSRFTFRALPQLVDDASSSAVVRGEWGERTAGGRPFFPTFMTNPQYHLQLAGSGCRRLFVFLEEASLMSDDAAQASAPVNLRAALHTSERVCGVPGASAAAPGRPKVLSSGEYRPGFCVVEVAGDDLTGLRDVVLIPSTFEAGVRAAFTLRVVSDPPHAVSVSCREVPPEGFGMEATTLHGAWELASGSAAGCSNYGCYTFNPKFLVRVPRDCELFVRLQVPRGAGAVTTTAAAAPAINVSIFESAADGSLLLSTNPTTAFRGASSEGGVYASGNPSGVVANKGGPLFPAGWYVVLPSTFEPVECAFELTVFASVAVDVRRL